MPIGRRGAIALALMLAVSCGGGSPSGPGTSTTPTFLDGWTEQPVAGASANPPTPEVGNRIHVEAAGYLPRDTTFDATPLRLWPGDAAYVQAIVYFPEVGNRLTRWTDSAFAIGLGPLLQDAGVRAVVEQAAAEAGRATGLAVTIAQSGPVSLAINPDDPAFTNGSGAVGVTYLTLSGSRIVSAQVAFKSRAYLTGDPPSPFVNNFLHELGHVVGLGHSPRLDDVMDAGSLAKTQALVYSDRERVLLKMMYRWRSPGNTAPDRDPGLGAADRTRRVVRIAD